MSGLDEVLICARHFPPAYRSGGPPRSLGGLVKGLQEEFRFSVLTMANDRNRSDVMPGVTPDTWSTWGPADVMYHSSHWQIAQRAARMCRAARGRVLYLNSFFDVHFTLLPLLAVRFFAPKTPIVLAPRGEFSHGALSLKPRQKSIYRKILRRSGLLRRVLWQASTDDEVNDIRREVGESARVEVARNLRESPPPTDRSREPRRNEKLSIVFLSRIAPMKNLKGLIEGLALTRTPYTLTIAGPVADADYWTECRQLIAEANLGDRIEYVGDVPPEEVFAFLGQFDLFVLASHGENFGHVVLESLLAGTPVVVSDQTPWGAVSDQGAGLVVDIGDPQNIAAALEQLAALPADARVKMSDRALALGKSSLGGADVIASNVALFRAARGA